MKRRSFLGTLGAAILLAGCAGDSPADQSTPNDSDSPTADGGGTSPTETHSAGRVEVTDAAVQPGIVQLSSPDSIGVMEGAGQYLLVHLAVEGGDGPARDAITYEFDGETHAPTELSRALYRDGDYTIGYDPAEGGGWLVFELPETGEAGSNGLSWPGGTWTLSDSVHRRLASPSPSFDVSFSAPATVDRNETPALTIAATNTGDVPGTCVLALNRVGPDVAYAPVRGFRWDVPPGETITRRVDGERPGPERSVTYHLHGIGTERTSRTIEHSGAENATDA